MNKKILKITRRLSLIIVFQITLILLFVNCVLAVEKIDSFKSTEEILIDGKWTNSYEWKNSSEESFVFGKGSGTAYLRVLNDDTYFYALVDFVSYNDTKTGDSCFLVFDTKNDGGSSIKSDDLAVLIRWNSPTEIYTAIQWGGWTGSWESLPSDIIVKSSKDIQYNPYSKEQHLIFEYQIPRSYFEQSLDTFGFIGILICDNENISAGIPLLQQSSQPENWNDLLLFNQTIKIYEDTMIAYNEANKFIVNAESDGRTQGLSKAKSLLNQAEDSIDMHSYNQAISLSNQALTAAEDATVPTENPDENKDSPGFEIIILVIAIALVLFYVRRKQF